MIAFTCNKPQWWHLPATRHNDGIYLQPAKMMAFTCNQPQWWHLPATRHNDGSYLQQATMMAFTCSQPQWWHLPATSHNDGSYLQQATIMAFTCNKPQCWHLPATSHNDGEVAHNSCHCHQPVEQVEHHLHLYWGSFWTWLKSKAHNNKNMMSYNRFNSSLRRCFKT